MNDGTYWVFALIVAALLALIPANIAKSKGRSFGLWWLYGWMLFIIALIHALSLPYNQDVLDKKAEAAGERRKCPQCAEYIKHEAKVCRFCGYDLSAIVEAERAAMWRCPDCRAEVRFGATRCAKCGRKLDFEGALPSSTTGWRCPDCKSEVSEGDVRCRKCGRKLDFG